LVGALTASLARHGKTRDSIKASYIRRDPQTNVVDVLVCRVRNKVEKGHDKKLIKTLRGMGYVLEGN